MRGQKLSQITKIFSLNTVYKFFLNCAQKVKSLQVEIKKEGRASTTEHTFPAPRKTKK